MSAWVLPDHIADVLPSEARHIEEIRRDLLDMARCYGYELVMPPLLEHLESLLSGTGEALDLQTFKLVDQLSGRMMGLRADSTPQVARIDAHLLNRDGVTRLCYCGPVLHTRPSGPHATREPLQFGAEIYGHTGLEADLEILTLALDSLKVAQVGAISVDMADARIVHALLKDVALDTKRLAQVHAALAAKDASELKNLLRHAPIATVQALNELLQLYGDGSVLDEAQRLLPKSVEIEAALVHLKWLASHLDGAAVSFDLADLRGYAYYSGAMFSMYAPGASDGWPAEVGTMRSVWCSGASARRSALVWTSRRSRVLPPNVLCVRRFVPHGARPRNCVPPLLPCAARAKPWCAYCQGMRAKLMSSIATANCFTSRANGL